MIPKKIHYIWLGKKTKSKLTELCINTWKRNLPDYEIIEWNEDNLEILKLCKENAFLKHCYDLKLWAFVSDYIRLWILFNYGGIYLDTDVEVIKSFNPLLENRVFFGYEVNDYIGTATIGAEPGNELIEDLLKFYEDEIWNVDFINNPIIFKYIKTNNPNMFINVTIYPQDYFSPYVPGVSYIGKIENSNTYTIHWYTKNWNINRRGYVFINTKHLKGIKKLIGVIRKNIGYYRLNDKK